MNRLHNIQWHKPGFLHFMVLFIILCFIYGIDSKLFLRPQSIHMWRQADCLSITQNYYQRDNMLWEPEIYNLIGDEDTTGKSAGEFPGLYYLVALLWKIFGKSEFIYRLLVLLISFCGMYAVFKLARGLIKDRYIAMFISLFLYTSTIYVTYSISFLPNMPALSLTLIGWFFIWRFYVINKNKHLWLGMLFFTLAMLLKVSSGISFVALAGWLFLQLLRKKEKRVLFIRPYIQMIPFLLAIVIVSGWYVYAAWYNNLHNGYYTFNNVWPIWEVDRERFLDTINGIRILWINEFFPVSIWYVTAGMWIFLLVTFRKRSFFLNYLLIIIPIGCLIYMLLWFKAFRDHDYYYIEFFAPFILSWIVFFKDISGAKWFRKPVVYFLLVVIFILSANDLLPRFDDRFDHWMNKWYVHNMEAVGELEPLLRSSGIKEDDIVISIPDHTINASLYLMNQRGYTDYGSDFSDPDVFRERIGQGAKYLVVNDSSLLEDETLKAFTGKQILKYKNVLVFELGEGGRTVRKLVNGIGKTLIFEKLVRHIYKPPF